MTDKVNKFLIWAESQADIIIADLDCFELYKAEVGCEDLTEDEKIYLRQKTKVKIKQLAYTKRITTDMAKLILSNDYGIKDSKDSAEAVVDEEFVTIIMEKPTEK